MHAGIIVLHVGTTYIWSFSKSLNWEQFNAKWHFVTTGRHGISSLHRWGEGEGHWHLN